MFSFIIVSLILIAHICLLFLVGAAIDFYYLFVVFLCSFSFLRVQYIQLRAQRPKYSEIFKEMALFVSALLVGLLIYDHRSLWLDEFTQATYSTQYWKCLSCAAAIEQQPPMSYALSALSIEFIGKSVLSLRLASILFFSVSLVFYGRILKEFLNNRYLQVLGLFLYLFNTLLFYYFIEARPYALFLCFALMYIEVLYKFVTTSDDSEFYKLISLSTLLLLTIGFQSEILVASSVLLVFFTSTKIKFMRAALAQVIAAVLFLPILSLIIYESYKIQQFIPGYPGGYFQHLWQTGTHFVTNLSFGYKHFWPDLLIGCAGFLGYLQTRKRKPLFMALLLACFSLVFIPLYASLINWNLLPKYFIILVPIVIAIVLMGFDFLLLKLKIVLTPTYLKVAQGMLGVLFFAKVFSYLLFFESRVKPFTDTSSIQWQRVYTEISPELDGDDMVYTLGLSVLGDWGLARPIAVEYYLGEKYWQFARNRDGRSVLNFDFNHEVRGKIFIILPRSWSVDILQSNSYIFSLPGVSLREFGLERVVEIAPSQESANQRLINFFEGVTALYGQEPWSINIWASLAKLYQIEGRVSDQRNALAKIVDLPTRSHSKLTGTYYNYRQLLEGFLFEVDPTFRPFAQEKKQENQSKNR